jgi:ornithine cyclodeaminase
MPVLLLSEPDVRHLLDLDELIEAMQAALAEFSRGGAVQPVRTVLAVPESNYFGVMPAFVSTPTALGAKLVTVFHGNAARGLPSHLATILLLDSATGGLLAVLDGRYITEIRTAAVSAVSARLLALPQASTLAIIGSGVQARSHLEALLRVRALREVRVWSPTRAHRDEFVRVQADRIGCPVLAADDVERAVRDAQLIVLATAATSPVLRSAWVADGAHIMAVGACRPDQREAETDLVVRARVFVDSRAGALAEAGDLVLPMAEGRFAPSDIAGELGELVAGDVTGRATDRDVTLFKSLGMAVEDVVTAALIHARALQRGIGQLVEM